MLPALGAAVALGEVPILRRSKARIDFSTKANGTPTKFDSAQLLEATGSAPLAVLNGKAGTNAASGAATGYMQGRADDPITLIWGLFTMGAYSTPNGVIALPLFDQSITDGDPTQPNSPCHPVIKPTGADYGVFSGNNPESYEVLGGTIPFAQPLVADDTTPYFTAIAIDYANKEAVWLLPNGEIVVIKDSTGANRIGGQPARYGLCEAAQTSAATDSKGRFIAWGFDDTVRPLGDTHADMFRMLKTIYGAIPSGFAMEVESSTGGNVTVPVFPTISNVDATNLALTFIAPPSGAVEIEAEAHYQMAAAGTLYDRFLVDGVTYDVVLTNERITDRRKRGRRKITGLVPGKAYPVLWQHTVVGTTAVIVRAAGQPAVLKVTPLK